MMGIPKPFDLGTDSVVVGGRTSLLGGASCVMVKDLDGDVF